MLLQRLKLHNIRSYQDQVIEFPEGSILLSGDIGSGKSTILLAIEFALFGTSRPDLPGEMLLRKGSQHAQVELTFSLRNQTITIVRNLKREKDAIKQTAGHIIMNNSKKELTAVELKAEILSLLGYPEEFITKNKNYIFRYTVYTPQEEMKFILQEDPETRLDTVRKIFNLDRYRNIRENINLYLRQMRVELAVASTKLEAQEGLQRQHQNIVSEQNAIKLSLQQLQPKLEEVQQQLQQQQQAVEKMEQEQYLRRELQHKQAAVISLQEEHARQLTYVSSRLKNIELQLQQVTLPAGVTRQSIEEEKTRLEETKNRIVSQHIQQQERGSFFQKQIEHATQEMARLELMVASLPHQESALHELRSQYIESYILDQKKEQLDGLLTQTLQMISKNDAILEHSQHLRDNINALDNCPLCLQHVGEGHKQSIRQQEDAKIQQAQNLLRELQDKKIEIEERRDVLITQIKKNTEIEHQRARLELELQQLRMQRERQQQLQQQRSQWQQELAHVQEEYARMKLETSVESIQQELQRWGQVWSILLQQEHLHAQLQELMQQAQERTQKIAELKAQQQEQETNLGKYPDRSTELLALKKSGQENQVLEKSYAVQQAQLQAQQQALARNAETLQQQLLQLQELQQKYQRQQEWYRWLEEYFVNLTYTIEKHVLLNIYHLFNQLFQEWFAILIDDPSVYSRIDDSFYPVIEQNGYEVPFLHLSGGEKTSAALAYRLALNRVINDVIHTIATKDLLILDEPTDGFSSEQLDKVREVLERLHLRQTVIVSHESKMESFVENVIRIRKENHTSAIIS